MILDLVEPTHESLRTKSERFDFGSSLPIASELARDLLETMKSHDGLGLAAPQVGINLRVFGLKSEPDAVIFNPRIVDVSEEVITLEEGCLSFPGLIIPVTRPRHIKLRFQLEDGETRTLKLTGLTARIVQHEVDHLDGKLFFSGLSKLKLDMLERKAGKRGHKFPPGMLHRLSRETHKST